MIQSEVLEISTPIYRQELRRKQRVKPDILLRDFVFEPPALLLHAEVRVYCGHWQTGTKTKLIEVP
jgi:hypothetical protein